MIKVEYLSFFSEKDTEKQSICDRVRKHNDDISITGARSIDSGIGNGRVCRDVVNVGSQNVRKHSGGCTCTGGSIEVCTAHDLECKHL